MMSYILPGHPGMCPSLRSMALREPTLGRRVPEIINDRYHWVFKAQESA